jgi:hypothetical protein
MACLSDPTAGGVTKEEVGVYTVRVGSELTLSPSNEMSWLKAEASLGCHPMSPSTPWPRRTSARPQAMIVAGAKKWIDEATRRGHSLKEERGGWK